MEPLTLYTCVPSSFMQKTLLKGFLPALIGIVMLLYSGIFFNLAVLTSWGFFIFIMSLGLITVGLLPYRRLTRLASNPDKMVFSDHVLYYRKNRCVLDLPSQAIEKMEYFENGDVYGIGVWLKPEFKAQDTHTQQRAKNKFQSDLFFPYFSRRSFEELQHWSETEDQDR